MSSDAPESPEAADRGRGNPMAYSPQRLLPWGVFVGTLSVYVLTLCPTVPGGDAGELIVAAASGGVAHPPGYPLFSILGRVFSWLPFGTVAWRINLMSAVCGAGAATFLFLAVRRWTGSPVPGLFSSGLFAFSPLVWRYAVTAEVFALNNLLLAAMLAAAVRVAQSPGLPGLISLAALAGLGVSNHHASVLLSVPLLGWAAWTARAALTAGGVRPLARRLTLLTGASTLGVLPYVYLPLAARAGRVYSWGATDSVEGFLTHLLRAEYGTFRLVAFGASDPDLSEGILRYVGSLPGELTVPALLLAAYGGWTLLRRERTAGVTAPMLASLALYLLLFEGLANLPFDSALFREVHARFWQQPNLLLAAAAGLGLQAASAALPRRLSAPLLLLAILATPLRAALNFHDADHSQNRVVADYGRTYLESLPREAILVTRGDLTTNTLLYLQRFEGVRPDVRVLDREMLALPWFDRQIRRHHPEVVLPCCVYGRGDANGYDLRQLISGNIDRFPVLLTSLAPEETDNSWRSDYDAWPFSYANRLVRRGAQLDLANLVAEHERGLAGRRFASPGDYRDGSWEREALRAYWQARFSLGQELVSRGVAASGDTRRFMLSLAAGSLSRLVREHPTPSHTHYKYLGVAYQELGLDAERREAFTRYLLTAPPEDPGYEAIRSSVSDP